MIHSSRRSRFALLLAVALVWACASAEERFAEHIARGEEYLEEK